MFILLYSPTDSLPLAAIIGIAVGGSIALLVIVVLVLLAVALVIYFV